MSMSLSQLPLNLFDLVVIVVLAAGIYRGRRHGMSEELLNLLTWLAILLGCATLSCYGLVVNSVKWEFSRLLGVYVGVFAALSVLFGRFAFRESIPGTTWCGLALIILGGLIIQFGH